MKTTSSLALAGLLAAQASATCNQLTPEKLAGDIATSE